MNFYPSPEKCKNHFFFFFFFGGWGGGLIYKDYLQKERESSGLSQGTIRILLWELFLSPHKKKDS